MDSDFEEFQQACKKLGFPELSRMDDFMEFLDSFTGEIRESVTQRVRKDLHWRHHNPSGTEPRGADPDSEEGQRVIDAAVREELRDCARKLGKLMEGLA